MTRLVTVMLGHGKAGKVKRVWPEKDFDKCEISGTTLIVNKTKSVSKLNRT